MRISGGDARGIRLRVPKGARPASERVRLAVFSALAARVPGARVLDLYCGSGAYALEALSRGADEAVLVDRDPAALKIARANAAAAGLSERVTFRRRSVDRYLAAGPGPDGPFDLVFVDPPYDGALAVDALLERLTSGLAEDARVVLESRRSAEPEPDLDGYLLEADRRYGDTRVRTYRRRRSQEER